MPDKPAVPAVYDPNRDPTTGHFRKGNVASAGSHSEAVKRFRQLRSMWFDANCLQDVQDVKAELKNLCLTCEQPDVKLRAIIYYLDRTLGKPTERVEMDVSSEGRQVVLPELTAEEVKVLQKVVRRSQPFDTDATQPGQP